MSPAPTRREYYERFAARIIDQIRRGVAPWQKPWRPGERALPENMRTGRAYTGGNTVYLAMSASERGYADNRWGTYRQIKALGGHVRRGETGHRVVFFANRQRIALRDADGKVRKDKDGKTLYGSRNLEKPVWRTYVVFNAGQARGLPLPRREPPEPSWMPQKRAEAVIARSGVDIRHLRGDRANYHLGSDRVTLPERHQFPSAGNYYQTALHELAHATGHESRLDRETLQEGIKSGFGSPQYAREELRAEIASMMTGDRLKTGHDPARGAAYVEGWVAALEEDPREIHRAAADAQRMSNYLVGPARELIEEIEQEHAAAREPGEPRSRAADQPDRPAGDRAVAPPERDRAAEGPSR